MMLKKYKTRELRTLSLLILVALLAVLSAPSLTDSLTYAQAPPPELTATSRMANQADLSWTEVSGATYVIVRQDRTTRRWETLESSYSGTTYTDTTAPAGKRYAYLISADGRNTWSNPETVFVGFYDAPTLNAPTASTLPSKIDVSWSTVAGTDNYDLWRHEQTEGWVQVADGQTGTTYADSAVDIGKNYLYQVQAHGALGAGAWSDQRSASVPSTAPGMPLNLVATAGNAEVMLEWNEPVSDGGSAITAYEYRYQMAGGSWTNWTDTIPALSRTVTIGSLTNDSQHNFEVRAENANGAGAIATASATPMSTVPGIPTGLGTTSTGPTDITLGWTAVDGATSYQLQRRTNGGAWGDPMDAGSGTSYTDMDLTPSTTYDYEVRAVNAAGESDWSAVVTATTTAPTAPDAVSDLAATASADKIMLSWTMPAGNGAAITGYDLDVSDDGTANSWSDLSTPAAGDTSAEHMSLAPGTMKYYRIRAMNSIGYSDWSASAMATVPAVAPDAPILSASAAGTTITLAWTAPASDGGAAITGYAIQYSMDGTGAGTGVWRPLATKAAGDASHEHTGLRAGDTRYYRINASNSQGASDWSNIDSATIGGADPPTGETPDGTSPRNLRVTADDLAGTTPGSTMTSITLEWDYPSSPPSDGDDATALSFEVEVWNDATQAWGTMMNATSATDPTPVVPDLTLDATAGDGSVQDTGLMGTTKYTYRVRAVDGTGTGAVRGKWSTQESATTVAVSPPKPVLTGSAPEFGKIMLSWTVSGDGGSPIIGYELQILHGAEPDTGTWEDYIGSDGSWRDFGELSAETAVLLDAPQMSVTQTLPATTGAHGTPHHYRIRAVNGVVSPPAAAGTEDAARSEWSDVRSVTALTGVPQDEATVDITSAAGSVTFALSAQTTSTGGSDILSNELQEWDPEAQEWKTVADSLTITYEKSGLGGNVTVKFRYRTRNANGYSKWFHEEGTTPAGAPSAPKLTATVNGPDSISLSWTKPNNGGTAITGYTVEASETGGDGFTALTGDDAAGLPAVGDTTADTLTATHTGLSAGVTRYYRVRATNGTEGPNSAIVMATTTTGGVPGAPTWADAHPAADGSTTVNLEWVVPDSNGGSDITGYDLAVWEDGDWNTFETSLATTPTEYNHGGRSGMTRYYYRVRARNANGPGLWSVPGSTTTEAGAPSKTMMLTATADGPDKIKLTWTAPANGGDPITSYLVQASNSRTAGWGPFEAGATGNVTVDTVEYTSVTAATGEPAPPLTVTHTGLTGMTTKYYRVRASNASDPAAPAAADLGPWSDVMSATTPAGKPAIVELVPFTDTELADKVVLTWTAPANGGSAITGYQVQYWKNGAWMDLASVGGSATTYTHEPVPGMTENHYRVRAVNAVGDGPWSATQTRTTIAGKPGAPVLNAGANGSSEIRLTWTIPATGGGDLTNYDIQYSSDGTSGWTWDQTGSSIHGGLRVLRTAVVNTVLANDYSHKGLDPSTTRHYRVRAVNASGEGPWSNVAMAMTTGGKPGKPTLTASASGTTMISLSWKPPAGDGGSPITGYEIEYWDGSNGWTDLAMPAAGATTHIHRNLSGGMTKYYRIRAMNNAGYGAWSTIAHATTTTSVPAPPTLMAMADGQTKIKLTWTAGASGGLPTTEYHLQHSTNAGRAWADVSLGDDKMVMTYTDMGLTGGTTKHYRVRAMNSKGWSGWSPLASDTTDVSVPGRPELTVTGQTRGRILLDWEAATGGAAIIRYEIQRWDSEARRWVDLPSTSGTSYTDTGRMSTKKYFYRVRAVNRIGDGPWSTFGNGSPTSN